MPFLNKKSAHNLILSILYYSTSWTFSLTTIVSINSPYVRVSGEAWICLPTLVPFFLLSKVWLSNHTCCRATACSLTNCDLQRRLAPHQNISLQPFFVLQTPEKAAVFLAFSEKKQLLCFGCSVAEVEIEIRLFVKLNWRLETQSASLQLCYLQKLTYYSTEN